MELKSRVRRLFQKSTQILKLLCFDNGSIIAGPTSQGYCDHIWKALGTFPLTHESLGYHRVWVRDGTYIAMALDATGNHDQARKFYEWCMQIQDHSGYWVQCYWPDGRKAMDNLEIDEVGTPIFGAYNHYLMTGDKDLLAKSWPMIQRAATFLIQNLAANNLMTPSYDLWEERWGHHLYSNVAAVAGFLSASRHAEEFGKETQAEKWKKASEILRESILRKFLLAEKGYFVRSVDPVDANVDVSNLGLTYPFSLLPPEDSRMVRTVGEIEAKLVRMRGVMRYSDKYNAIPKSQPWKETTGNLWVPATLWLALYYLKAKRKKKAERLYEWAIDSASDDFLLPQQIDEDGRPHAAIPYGMAHALFILATLELDKWHPSNNR